MNETAEICWGCGEEITEIPCKCGSSKGCGEAIAPTSQTPAPPEIRSTDWLAPDETISLLGKARDEIRQLRRTNEILGAKVEAFDCLMQLLHTKPAEREYPIAVDVAWELDKHAEEIKRRFSTSEKG